MLVLHIGLPKTGTTFLQYQVFAKTPSLVYLHRRRSRYALGVTQGLRAFSQATPAKARAIRTRLVPDLRRIRADGRTVVISDENVAVGPRLFWTGGTAPPEKVARRIAQLGQYLPQELLPLRALVGVREQDQWLASSYAEFSLRFPEFCQADFDRRMTAIASVEEDRSLAWLDYGRAKNALVEALGAENVLLLPLERLSAAPAETIGQLSAFLGNVDLHGEKTAETTRQPSNQLSTGENVWRLRRDDTPLRLEPQIQDALRRRFAASNRALAVQMPLGFTG